MKRPHSKASQVRAQRRDSGAPGARTLAAAASVVRAVAFDGRSADVALEEFATREDRSAIRAIALGTLRWYLRLKPGVAPLVNRPFESLTPMLASLLVTAAHQVEYSRGPAEASVHLAVDATRMAGEARASGFVNAVLRRFVAERAALFAPVDADPASRHAHPAWLVEALEKHWGERADEVLAANNLHPPMVLRTDESALSASAFVDAWRATGRVASTIEWLPGAVVLERAAPVHQLPGFETGATSVQDAGAQLAAWLLDAKPGMRVLDACAAPGGKTLHIAQRTPDLGTLIAVDDDALRLARVRENLQRAGRDALLVTADLRTRPPSFEAASFDRVLVDAPCSATGVIRRHPDIKLLRRPSDIARFAATQLEILSTAFDLLRPGGGLVYCTCSVLPTENDAVVTAFLEREPRARASEWPSTLARPPGLIDRPVGWQLLPGGGAGTDGFYYACLGKTPGA
jgi:16S rRNA (cytosine967-C5)-methyltransferase